MPRQRIWAFCSVMIFLGSGLSPAAAMQPSETLLPEATKAFVSTADVELLIDHWNKTQMGKLMHDPVMKPFADDLRRQIEEQWLDSRHRLGLTLDELRGVPSGEVAGAVVMAGADQPAMVLLADVTGHLEQAQELLAKVKKNLDQQGATGRTAKIDGVEVQVFDLPKLEDALEGDPPRQAIYVLKDEMIIASDKLAAVGMILDRLQGGPGKSLADVAAFQAVTKRYQDDGGQGVPQIRWFVEPFGYAAALRASLAEHERPQGKTIVDTLRNQGFTAIQGVGGSVDLAVDGFELVHRTFVCAPRPYEKSMKMLKFPNVEDFSPETWVPRDVATYTTVFVDIANLFANFGPMFDELFGEGETGVWPDVLDGLKNDPDGPQIDLKAELIDKLGGRVTVVTAYELPISTTSERILIAIEAKDTKAVAKAIEKMFKDDEGVVPRAFGEYRIWESVPQEKPTVPAISLDAVPLLPGEEHFEEKSDEDREGERLFPNLAVTSAKGHLFIASHMDFLLRVLQQQEEKRETLAGSVDYQVVREVVGELAGGKKLCGYAFSRMDEEYRATYELIQQGKMPQSETMLGRVLNTVFGAGKKGVIRQQELDGTKLPEFDVVRRYLGNAGGFAVSEDGGWFVKGVMLGKESE